MRIGVDEKEADPVAVALPAVHARGDDELVGAVALTDERLFPVQHESAIAVLDGAKGDIAEIVAGLPFHMSEA